MIQDYLETARISSNSNNKKDFDSGRIQYLVNCKDKILKMQYKNIAIYGVGEHTKKLIEFFENNGINKNNLKCLISNKIEIDSFCELPIYELEEARERFSLDAIVISSYKFETVIYERILDKIKDSIDIIKIYDCTLKEADERIYFEDDNDMGINRNLKCGNVYFEHINRYYFALSFVKDKVVLDVACGSGYGTNILSQKAKKIFGVDIDSETINYAERHYKKDNCNFINSKIEELKIDEKVDVIVSFETIEHINDEEAYFKTVKSVLDKDGIFIVSTPVADTDGISRMNQYHINEYTVERFTSTLKKRFKDVIIYRQDEMNKGAIAIDDGQMLDAKPDITYMIAVCYN